MDDKKIYVTRSSMPPYEEYIEAIKPLWESRWLTNMGKYHMELENNLKEYLDVENLSLMVNGHMALELAIQAMGFPENGEVITTPFTFISTTHAIVRNRLTPVFCDVKMSDGTIDESKIEDLITEKTVAIVPVHVYGNICNVEKIDKIAHKYNLKVIYDAAHAFGVEYKGRGIGNYGDASIFSFHATKVFHTIEGGAVTFSDPRLYETLYNLKNFGIRGEERVISVGANAKMNEFSALMGLCNLKYVNDEMEKRAECWKHYRRELEKTEGISFFDSNAEATRNYSYFPILIEDNYRMDRNELYDFFKDHNIYARKYFYPITSVQECYRDIYANSEVPVAKKISDRILTLPIYAEMNKEDMEQVVRLIG